MNLLFLLEIKYDFKEIYLGMKLTRDRLLLLILLGEWIKELLAGV